MGTSASKNKRGESEKEEKNTGGTIAETSKWIAVGLIASYVGLLVLVLLGALLGRGTSNGQTWFDLFKSGFLLLGGALTTIIGYYFGSAAAQDLENRMLTEKKRAEEAEKEINRLIEEKKSLAPTKEEESLPPYK